MSATRRAASIPDARATWTSTSWSSCRAPCPSCSTAFVGEPTSSPMPTATSGSSRSAPTGGPAIAPSAAWWWRRPCMRRSAPCRAGLSIHSLHGYFLRPSHPGRALHPHGADASATAAPSAIREVTSEVEGKTAFIMTLLLPRPRRGRRVPAADAGGRALPGRRAGLRGPVPLRHPGARGRPSSVRTAPTSPPAAAGCAPASACPTIPPCMPACWPTCPT